MKKLLLLDPMVNSDNDVLKATLKKRYKIYQEFSEKINEKKLVLEWNYYNDQKSWLCKVLLTKKICVGFQFGILDLN